MSPAYTFPRNFPWKLLATCWQLYVVVEFGKDGVRFRSAINNYYKVPNPNPNPNPPHLKLSIFPSIPCLVSGRRSEPIIINLGNETTVTTDKTDFCRRQPVTDLLRTCRLCCRFVANFLRGSRQPVTGKLD